MKTAVQDRYWVGLRRVICRSLFTPRVLTFHSVLMFKLVILCDQMHWVVIIFCCCYC